MSFLLGDTGKGLDGTLKTINFTLGTAYENLIGTPLIVPNQAGIPASPITSYIVSQSAFPTVTPNVFSMKYNGFLVFCGKNTDSGSRTVNWQVNKNGASSNSGSTSTNSNQFWTLINYKLLDIAVNDVLDIYVWCSTSTLINFDYVGFFIIPASVQLSGKSLLKDVTFNYTTASTPSLAQGTPNIGSSGSTYLYPSTSNTSINVPIGSASNVSYTMPYITGLNPFRLQYGDSNSQSALNYNSATNRPNYARNFSPASITFREVLR